MNVSELARQLKITTNELLEKAPQLGFDIGRRAIKVDDRIARKIMDAWKKKSKTDREMSRIAEIRGEGNKEEVNQEEVKQLEVEVPSIIVVREFAALLNVPVNKVLIQLMKNGVLTSMNERIDFDTASIIGEELGFKILEKGSINSEEAIDESQEKLKNILSNKEGNLIERPPVIVVMGHVDHGKTKILDAIRKADVVSTESGGITQHIGAYQIRKNNRLMTFIDTPGHEAFTAMRSRGARVADVAILVVAADDGVQPQTKEAIKIIQDAGLPFVVAINKIDKPEANTEKTKQDLSALGLLPEDWGGETICMPVSAKEGTGINDLLETVLLVADLNKDTLMTDPDRLAIGTIIESHIDKGEGPVATILVQSGTLRVGDVLCLKESFCGKVRMLKDYKGEQVLEASPGTPAKILGLKLAPEVGSVMEASGDIKKLNRDIEDKRTKFGTDISLKTFGNESDSDKIKAINLIIKADVLGSLEAILESLAKLETDIIKIKIIGKGLGLITESDIAKAEVSNAKVIGFHVKPSVAVSNLARDKKVEIKQYAVIYHLIEDIKGEMETMEVKESVKKLVGTLKVLKIFRKETNSMIVGGRVEEGHIVPTDTVIIVRDSKAVASGKVKRIESGKQQTERVSSGQECGLGFEGKAIIEEGDMIEFYIDE